MQTAPNLNRSLTMLLLETIPARWAVALAALLGSALGASIARAFLSAGR